MDQDLQESQQQKQELTESSNPGSDIAQYILADDGKRSDYDPERERVCIQQGQYPQTIPPPQLQSPRDDPQGQHLSIVPIQEQQEQLQLPLESQTSNDVHLHRSKTCPALDHEELLQLENSGQGNTTPESRLDGPHPFAPGRFHSAGDREEEESWDESTASCFARARHRIGKVIETKKAHIIILCLTLVDIILVMLQIGASLLRLDETEEELWFIALFGHLSLAIISLFVLEILLKFFAFGPRYFMPRTKHWFLHLLDAVIILTSFMLEIFLKGAEQELTSLLIVFRLWRVVKLTGTVAIEVAEHDEQKVVILEQKVHDLERELEFSQVKVQRLEAFIGGFQSQ